MITNLRRVQIEGSKSCLRVSGVSGNVFSHKKNVCAKWQTKSLLLDLLDSLQRFCHK